VPARATGPIQDRVYFPANSAAKYSAALARLGLYGGWTGGSPTTFPPGRTTSPPLASDLVAVTFVNGDQVHPRR
jgi:hypothetical protein